MPRSEYVQAEVDYVKEILEHGIYYLQEAHDTMRKSDLEYALKTLDGIAEAIQNYLALDVPDEDGEEADSTSKDEEEAEEEAEEYEEEIEEEDEE